MLPAMHDEIVERQTPRITKQTTNWREPLDPGLKVALTILHLASGAKYSDMQYTWLAIAPQHDLHFGKRSL